MSASSPRPHVSRPHARRTFTARIAFLAPRVAHLEVQPGAWRRTVDAEGDIIADTFNPSARLWANVGDRLLVAGDALDDIAIGEVYAVAPDGTLNVQLTCGSLPTTTAKVHVLPSRRATVKRPVRPVLRTVLP